jgi:pseudouridine synthase, RluA family
MKLQVNPLSSDSGPRLIEIDGDEAGQRIDNFLIARLKGVPKSHIYRLLRKGEIRVNKGRIKAQYRLCQGDLVRLPPVRVSASPTDLGADALVGKRLEQNLLYEDRWLLVLNKPAGMAVHGGSGIRGGVIESLRASRPGEKVLELVHRLDKETSGCLLIAKKRQVLRALHTLIRDDDVDKRYLALITGKWRRRRQLVDVPLRKYVLKGGERMVRVDREGKPSRTEFRRLRCFDQGTLVDARLLTGRTHQIRVHASHLGHPIAGDERYGRAADNGQWRSLGLRRMFLHAWRLDLPHPVSGERLHLEAPLSVELQALLDKLEQGLE